MTTPKQLYREARERIDIFNQEGGFVLDAIHNLQGNTRIENIEEMFKAICESGRN